MSVARRDLFNDVAPVYDQARLPWGFLCEHVE
jgi:hypothetical protein